MGKIERDYGVAREIYAEYGVDTEAALKELKEIPISMNCWELDDLTGFEDFQQKLTGGIAATGSFPGKPESVEEYFDDLNEALSYIPGAVKLALHASYSLSEERAERNKLTPEHFCKWVDYAREKKIGLDFNPTYFSHPMAESGMTLASADAAVRQYWIEHGIACRRIGAYFGKKLGQVCITNHWIPDGSKDCRVDKIGPRERLTDSLNQIFDEKISKEYNLDSVESKLFGLGVESYTVGSHEYYTNYVMLHDNCIICMDTGHFHPTELVSDKLSAYLCFGKEIMLHVSRPVRWDSDHVVTLDDELKNLMNEIVRCDGLGRVHIGTDYFDASIHRVAATVLGVRNTKKALLNALLQPNALLKRVEAEENCTKRLALLEEMKSMPLGIVWNMFCEREGVPGNRWVDGIIGK